ncbi:MAG TPA: GNAT family N-acetyltransferase [Streptosporangiaceae bacterium]|nr:GNAT family N-acetyltransferase [Streptosporangiaceae bacterium]
MSSSPPETLELPHGVLVRLRESHSDLMSDAVLASLDHLKPWMPWANAEAGSPAAQRERCQAVQESWNSGSDYNYALRTDESGPVIGGFGLHRRVGSDGIEIGYWVHVDYVGRGYATAAAEALTRAGLGLDDVVHVEIHTDEANVKSAAIPQRLGYRLDRVFEREPEAPGESGRIQVWTSGPG